MTPDEQVVCAERARFRSLLAEAVRVCKLAQGALKAFDGTEGKEQSALFHLNAFLARAREALGDDHA